MSYLDSLPPSFGSEVFINAEAANISDAYTGADLIEVFSDPTFDIDAAGQFNGVADSLSGFGALSGDQAGWTFITAPEDVSWDIANNAQRVDIFGTNNPPVVAGSRGMRDLTLSNSLVEGFVRGVAVEGKISALENLMNYSLNASDGYVSVPVYQVWANEKSYGGPEAYYIIKDVKVKEAMRDLKGNSTRAYVDISLMQVPAYQVNSGRDQASAVTAGGVALTPEQRKQVEAAAKKGTDGKTAQNAAKDQVDGVKNKAATESPAEANSAKPSAPPTPSTVKPLDPNQIPTINTRPRRP
jgi:hypothetical protein